MNTRFDEKIDHSFTFQTEFDVIKELENVQSIETRVQQSVHALEGRFTQV